MGETDRDFDIVAAFPDPERAERVAKALERRGVPKRHLHLVRPAHSDPARAAEMRSEMADEVNEGVAGPGVGFLTEDQARGAMRGALVGMLTGLVLGLAVGTLWAFAVDSALSETGRMLIAAICFAIGGMIAGFVSGGALKPRFEATRHPGRMLDERALAGERGALLEVHVSSDDEASIVEEVLEHAGAERVDAVEHDGTPLPPQREHPRPADPPGYWQGNGRKHG
jgi:hypothetical protein